jgi:hypothetical protein
MNKNFEIHTFGDSHSKSFPEYVIKNYLGAILAYSVGKQGFEVLDITKVDIEEGDHIIFCFGEIDCRCHISKHHDRENDNTYKTNIDNITDNYVRVIDENIKKLNKNVNVWIYNVIPTVRKGAFKEHPSDEYPILGTNEERKNYVSYMNKMLKENCIKYNYKFFDIYDKYTDNEGFLIEEYRDELMHINNFRYIDEFIKNNIM